MLKQRIQIDAQPFRILATRYTPDKPALNSSACTLILLHGLGLHKESWEPFLRELLSGSVTHNVREVFSIENPNHGESAILNEDVLDSDAYRSEWKASTYANAAYTFLSAGPDRGAKIDFMSRNIIGIGHSLGGLALSLLAEKEPRLPFRVITLIEAPISILGHPLRHPMLKRLFSFIWTRRDTWPSLKYAEQEIRASLMYSTWTDESIGLFLKHGIRPHKASKYHDPYKFSGVSTALTKEHEAATFRDEEPCTDCLSALKRLSADASIDVHLVFGDVADFAPLELKEYQVKHSSPQSVSWIENCGHMCVQQSPDKLASVIAEVLKLHSSVAVKL